MLYTPYSRVAERRIRNIISATDYPIDSEPGKTLATLEAGVAITEMSRHRLATFLPRLRNEHWFFASAEQMWRAYRLRYVSLETTTVCNQRCFFCPVSEAPRAASEMPDHLLDRILPQLAEIPTIEAVFLNNYNEPFVDKRTSGIIAWLNRHSIKVAINTNGSYCPPELALQKHSIELLTINLHTADRDKYRRERGRDHFNRVVENIRTFAEMEVAVNTRIAVLGDLSDEHHRECEALRDLLGALPIEIRMFPLMDRAGNLDGPQYQPIDHDVLWGCEQTGSRPVEHVHILPDGRCVLCCEDYYEHHVVGDLSHQTVDEVMAGSALAGHREIVFGFRKVPVDHLCRKCSFAVPGPRLRAAATLPAH